MTTPTNEEIDRGLAEIVMGWEIGGPKMSDGTPVYYLANNRQNRIGFSTWHPTTDLNQLKMVWGVMSPSQLERSTYEAVKAHHLAVPKMEEWAKAGQDEPQSDVQMAQYGVAIALLLPTETLARLTYDAVKGE